MKHKTLALWMSISVLAGALILALLPFGVAAAIPQATPTVKPFGDFVIPTATTSGGGFSIPTATTSGGGFTIPTATTSGGGFSIPTSTPAAPVGPGLPPLGDNDLQALNLQPVDVPSDFAGNQETGAQNTADLVATLRDAGSTDVANTLETLIAAYGWNSYVGVTYTSCQPTVPVSKIYSDVSQLLNPEAARAFIDDADVQYILSSSPPVSATNLHGWFTSSGPTEGVCFPQETKYTLNFEYWGLYMSIYMVADTNTDPSLITGLLEQLSGVMIAKVDAIASAPFPATPVPGSVSIAIPTQASSPTLAPISLPTQPTTTTSGSTLADIEGVIPTQEEIGLPSQFALNPALSITQTLDQIVAGIQALGLTELANATSQTGQRDGQIGTVIRVWDTGTSCPDTVGLSVEVDISLFQTPQGALTNMNDVTLQQAWINTGVISNFQPQGSGVLLASGQFQHQCGTVQYFNKLTAHGRFVVAVSAIGSQGADQQTLLAAIDQLSAYVIQKMDTAGLQ